MHRINWLECFHPGSPVHAVMVLAVVAFVWIFTGNVRRSPRTDIHFSNALFSICIISFLYYLRPNQFGWNHSLPLHICDVTGVMAAIAIRTSNRLARTILYFWGLTLSSQALIFPAVQSGPAHCDFWLYLIDHGAIVSAAFYDIRARGYRPTWHDWRMASILLASYAIVIAPFDRWMSVDYGFLGQTELSQTMVSVFGPWPTRIYVLWLCSIFGMAILKWSCDQIFVAGNRASKTNQSSLHASYKLERPVFSLNYRNAIGTPTVELL